MNMETTFVCQSPGPHSGYVSPEAMVTALSVTSNLEILLIEFRSPLSRPNRASRRPPPLTRTILPALTSVLFKGANGYIETLVSLIDVPLLHTFKIRLFNQLIFNTLLLHDFFARTEMFESHNHGVMVFSQGAVEFELGSRLSLRISCAQSDWQLSSMAQVSKSSLPLFSTLEGLDIRENRFSSPHWQGDVENTQWLEILRSFTDLNDLYLDEKFTPLAVPALQGLASERVMEVLPALKNLFIQPRWVQLSGSIRKAIVQFITARKLSGHPVVSHRWYGLS